MRRDHWIAVSLVAALAAVVAHAGCGATSSPSAPSTNQTASFPLSQGSIENGVTNFAKGMTNAANNGISSTTHGYTRSMFPFGFGPDRRFRIMPVQLTSVPVNVPIDYTVNCSTGGYHHIVGTVSGTINSQGPSYLHLNAHQSIVGYRCLAGGWAVDGDPYIANSGQITENNGRTSIEFDETLGWRAKSDSSGTIVSCQHSIRVTWDDLTGGRFYGEVHCSPPEWNFQISKPF